MTDKLHCPFCGAELLSDPEYLHSEHFHCENPECIFPSSVELHSSVWNKMIDGKKAQELLHNVAFIYLESVKADIQENPVNWEATARTMYAASQTKQEE